MPETFANNAIGQLSAGINNTATSLVLYSGQGAAFPATGNFRILVDSELMLVGARTADTLSSITRGIEGTAAAAHSVGAQVTHLITAGALGVFAQGAGVTAIGTSLPASPTDGQEAILVDSLTAPTYAWRFRYTASITDGYPWVCVGGYSAFSENINSEATASTTYAALGTAGPSFTVPRAGQYYVEIGVFFPALSSAGHVMSYDIGATAAVDADSMQETQPGGAPGSLNTSRSRLKTITAASTALVAKYRIVGSGTATFSNRWMRVTPARVA